MSATKLARLQALQQQVAELESDPDIQQEKEHWNHLSEAAKAVEVTEEEAAEMLVPNLAGAKPVMSIKGLYARPTSDARKWMFHLELKQLEKHVQERLEEMSHDPAVARRALLMSEIETLELTPVQAASLLAPERMEKIVGPRRKKANKSASEDGQEPAPVARKTRYWKNPHTGETVAARATSRITLKRWAADHGEHIYNDWEITKEEYEEAQPKEEKESN